MQNFDPSQTKGPESVDKAPDTVETLRQENATLRQQLKELRETVAVQKSLLHRHDLEADRPKNQFK